MYIHTILLLNMLFLLRYTGYFSEKHLACELHTYSCIALHCLMLKFSRSDWNRLANRRDIVLNFGHCRDPQENMMQVHITPENATFVDIKELCSDNLDVFLLDYTLTWRNIDVSIKFSYGQNGEKINYN